MKSLINISQNATPKYLLSFQDIENALFLSKDPELTVYPFPYKRIKRVSITFRVPFVTEEEPELKLAFANIIRIGNKKVVEGDSRGIPLILSPYIITHFLRVVSAWREYSLENMEEFCSTDTSILNWKSIQNGGIQYLFDSKLTVYQKLWLSINVQKDRDFWLKTATDIRESLLPWMNYNLWTKVEENKANKRENVSYTEQRKALIEGGLEDLNKQEYKDEDLDEIR